MGIRTVPFAARAVNFIKFHPLFQLYLVAVAKIVGTFYLQALNCRTVIWDVSLCSWCLCLETASRHRDFRQREEMKGDTKGVQPWRKDLLLQFTERQQGCM